MIPQFTTPTITLTFTEQGLDLTRASKVIVTIRSGTRRITKEGDALNISEKSIGIHLSQKETSQLAVGDAEIMANWMVAGERFASEKVKITMTDNLLAEVMT